MNCPQCNARMQSRGFRNGRPRYFCRVCRRWPTIVTEQQAPKILFFDIETLPIEAYVWGLGEQHLSIDQIKRDWCLLSWAAMWLDDEQVMSNILSSDEAVRRDDRRIVASMWQLLNDADIVVAHNGDGFDIPKLRSRFLYHRMYNPRPFKSVDTLKVARSQFKLSSNKLDFLVRFLGFSGKLETNMQLWIDCNAGDVRALNRMNRYCQNDVAKLRDVYQALLPYIPNHPNINLWREESDGKCPSCGSNSISIDGKHYMPTYLYDAYVCGDCHSRWRSRKK